MIVFQNVSKVYGNNVGLRDVNIEIRKGDFVFLVGPSGAGKSTFIKLILKEIQADSGKIMLDDIDITSLPNRKIPKLRRSLGIVFQDFRLLPKKTVYENVAFAMEIVHTNRRTISKQVPQVLKLVGISSKANRYPHELSAGEQQRVAIARALINSPKVLIADEPTGNLDPDTAWEIMKLLNQINMRGTTILMVTHAKDIVDRMGKRVIAIDKGQIVRDDIAGAYIEEELRPVRNFAYLNDDGSDLFPLKNRRLSRNTQFFDLPQRKEIRGETGVLGHEESPLEDKGETISSGGSRFGSRRKNRKKIPPGIMEEDDRKTALDHAEALCKEDELAESADLLADLNDFSPFAEEQKEVNDN